ncbi:hypothetical protein GOBAR_DD03556 [Gossypium barbadense]|nr:hypothetical protein GOBAR_DD03556 [Gossypium barbadense]
MARQIVVLALAIMALFALVLAVVPHLRSRLLPQEQPRLLAILCSKYDLSQGCLAAAFLGYLFQHFFIVVIPDFTLQLTPFLFMVIGVKFSLTLGTVQSLRKTKSLHGIEKIRLKKCDIELGIGEMTAAITPVYEIIMSGVPHTHASSQASRGTKRKWVLEEDTALVSCMADLHNIGTFNTDTGFKVGYLNELEKMLEKALPNAMLKAKPNIESRIRLLKREWSIVYDMLNGQNNSGFGWEEHRKLVVAEDAVWESYVKPRGDRDQRGPSSSNKRKKKYDARDNMYSSFDEAATLLAENIKAVGDQISRSIASEVVVQQKSEEYQKMEEKASNLYSTLWEIEGLSDDQRYEDRLGKKWGWRLLSSQISSDKLSEPLVHHMEEDFLSLSSMTLRYGSRFRRYCSTNGGRGHMLVWPGRVSHKAKRHARVLGCASIQNRDTHSCPSPCNSLTWATWPNHMPVCQAVYPLKWPHSRVSGRVLGRVKTKGYNDLYHMAKPLAHELGHVKQLTCFL